MTTYPNEQAISDAKALANTAVRGAIKVAHEIISGVQNPTFPSYSPADPTGKGGLAGGAHELSEAPKDENLDAVLKDHEERPKVEYKKTKMHRIDGASYHVFMGFVPSEYKDSFKPFDALVIDPEKSLEDQPDVELDDFDMKARADVQFGAGVALIYLESVLRS